MRCKDGSTFWTETAVTHAQRRDGTQYVVAYWEVPDPTRTVESEVPDNAATIMLDPSGTITGWDANAERLYGWTAEEAVGQPFGLFKPEYTEQDATEARQLLSRGHLRSTAVNMDKMGRRLDVCHDDAVERDAFGETVRFSLRVWEVDR